jgi:hypothetical protein
MSRKNHLVIKLLLSSVLPVLIVYGLASTGKYVDAAPDLNGVFRCNDGGTYYVRQIGNEVWWFGPSSDEGASFTNVYKGTISGDAIIGTWADVPYGQARGWGSMNLVIHSQYSFDSSYKTGGFYGSHWYREPPEG